MDPIARMVAAGAAGVSGDSGPLYVEDVFSTNLYEGNGSAQTINNGIDLSGKGGLVWTKSRNNLDNGYSDNFNRIRDTELQKLHYTNSVAAATLSGYATTFNSNGFTDSYGWSSGNYIVSWSFRKAPGFLDIVTWSGDTTDGRQIPHDLGSAPGMVIIKRTDSGGGGTHDSWHTFHRSEPTKYGALDSSRTFSSTVSGGYNMPEVFGDSSSTIIPDANNITVSRFQNRSGASYIAYIFAHNDQRFGANEDEAIIKCGSYEGTGSSDNFVELGFEPQWLLYKHADGTDQWEIVDMMRGMPSYNQYGNGSQMSILRANLSGTEFVDNPTEPTPTGFNIMNGGGSNNDNGSTYIYMAIRRPHKTPTDGTEVFDVGLRSGSSSVAKTNSSILTDMSFVLRRDSSSEYNGLSSRMQGDHNLFIDNDSGQGTGWARGSSPVNGSGSASAWDTMTGFYVNGGNGAANTGNLIDFSFKRAPGFFDVVAYAGDGSSTHEVGHNLTVIPNLIICKNLYGTSDWGVRTYAPGEGDGAGDSTGFNLNSTYQRENQGFGTFGITTTTFRPYAVAASNGNSSGTYGSQEFNTNGSRYLALLFATLDGVSKVGGYEGTGNNINLDCGFTSGARFVLIKRVNSTGGDWYVWNSATGIVSGNDPYLLLNERDSEVTNTDYIDPLNSGFTVTSSAPDALNESGGKYIYLDIA